MFGGMGLLVVGCAAVAYLAARAGARKGIEVRGGDGASAETAAFDRGYREGMIAQIDTSPTVR